MNRSKLRHSHSEQAADIEEEVVQVWRLEECPKCRGNIFLESDSSGWFVKCLQCGYTLYLESVLRVESDENTRKKCFVITQRTSVGGGRYAG